MAYSEKRNYFRGLAWSLVGGEIITQPVTLLTHLETYQKSDRQRRRKPKGPALATAFAATMYDSFVWRDSLYTQSGALGVSYHLASNFVALPRKYAPSAAAQARNKARAQLRETGVNFANMLGEYKATTNMFVRNAQTLYGMIRKVKRRYPAVIYQPRKRWDKAAADAWLEFTYGVKPLAQDLYDSYATWRDGSKGKPLIQRVQVSAHASSVGSTSKGTGLTNVTESWSLSRSDRVTAYAVMSNGGLSAALGQFGLTNPASLAWELTTMSFVVDWFVNVGEVLGSLDNPLYMANGITHCAGRAERNFQNVTHRRGMSTIEHSYKGRTGYGPIGSVAELVYNPSVGVQRALSAVALLRQFRR